MVVVVPLLWLIWTYCEGGVEIMRVCRLWHRIFLCSCCTVFLQDFAYTICPLLNPQLGTSLFAFTRWRPEYISIYIKRLGTSYLFAQLDMHGAVVRCAFTVCAIALGPSDNLQGGVRCYSLSTGKILRRAINDITPMKWTEDSLNRICFINKKQKSIKGLLFGDRQNELDNEAGITGVVEDNVNDHNAFDHDLNIVKRFSSHKKLKTYTAKATSQKRNPRQCRGLRSRRNT